MIVAKFDVSSKHNKTGLFAGMVDMNAIEKTTVVTVYHSVCAWGIYHDC